MTISANGLFLDLLGVQDIELLREWRNRPSIKSKMEFQAKISPEMQAAWYKTINNCNNFYFIIRKEETRIGMIHLSSIDWSLAIAEAGMFIVDKAYLDSPTPVFASINLLDFAFVWLKLKEVVAKVHKDNAKAIHYNGKLGFKYHKDTNNPDFILQKNTPESYFKTTEKLRAIGLGKYGKEFWLSYGNHELDSELSTLVMQRKRGKMRTIFVKNRKK